MCVFFSDPGHQAFQDVAFKRVVEKKQSYVIGKGFNCIAGQDRDVRKVGQPTGCAAGKFRIEFKAVKLVFEAAMQPVVQDSSLAATHVHEYVVRSDRNSLRAEDLFELV